MDTTDPFMESLIGNRYWIGVVNDYIRNSWSFFTKTKSQLPKKMEELFEKMTSCCIPVKYLRCDNAGEHQSKQQKACKKEKVKFEYMKWHTPELNVIIERRFAIIR